MACLLSDGMTTPSFLLNFNHSAKDGHFTLALQGEPEAVQRGLQVEL